MVTIISRTFTRSAHKTCRLIRSNVFHLIQQEYPTHTHQPPLPSTLTRRPTYNHMVSGILAIYIHTTLHLIYICNKECCLCPLVVLLHFINVLVYTCTGVHVQIVETFHLLLSTLIVNDNIR